MLSKFKIIAVFILIAGVFGIAIGTRVFFSQKRYRIENLPYNSVTSIKIFDRGLVGENTVTFTRRDSLGMLKNLILMSTPVEASKINFHGNKGLCDIVLHCTDGQTLLLSFYAAPFEGSNTLSGFLASGEFHYQNDALLAYLQQKLSGKD